MPSSKQFTAEVLLSAPRRGPAVPNSKGTKALYSVSTYSFETHSKKSEIKILDIESCDSKLFSEDPKCSEANWLGDDGDIVYFKSEEKGFTSLMVATSDGEHLAVAKFPGPVCNLKVACKEDGVFVLAMVGKGTPSGDLYNEETAEKPLSSVMIYNKPFVRYWDEYITENVNQIFHATIGKEHGKWTLTSELINSMAKTGMTSPFAWFGGDGSTEDFDVCSHGILFLARDPKINPIKNTSMDCWYVPLRSEENPHPQPIAIEVPGLNGVAWSPLFAPDGKTAVFHKTKYEEMDPHRMVLVRNIENNPKTQDMFTSNKGDIGEKLSCATNVCWNNDSQTIYFTAEENGIGHLWRMRTSEHEISWPQRVSDTSVGSISAAYPLSRTSPSLLVSSSTFTDNSVYTIVDPVSSASKELSANLNGLKDYGISHTSQVSNFWFQGAKFRVNAWMLKPSFFSENKKYPLAYLFHGGPEQAWLDAWSTRWNLMCLAEQGYIVVAVNFTGATGYGQHFSDAVRGEWGNLPFRDLELGFEHIEKTFLFVDTSRAVGLGGSYGGYMTAWIQGQTFARKFRAFFCHNGQMYNQSELSADDLTGSVAAFKGTYWTDRTFLDKWDPASRTKHWATPMLIVHGMLDYRVPIEQGLGMFQVLQHKGIDSKFITFPDENHWVLKPENSLVWHREVYQWINKYSGISYE